MALSPRMLNELADAELGPCAIELSPTLSETDQLLAGRLTRHLDSLGLLTNGKQIIRFYGGDQFPGDKDALFVSQGDAILVNLAGIPGAKAEKIEKAFKKAAGDSDLLEALAHFRAERTQELERRPLRSP